MIHRSRSTHEPFLRTVGAPVFPFPFLAAGVQPGHDQACVAACGRKLFLIGKCQEVEKGLEFVGSRLLFSVQGKRTEPFFFFSAKRCNETEMKLFVCR